MSLLRELSYEVHLGLQQEDLGVLPAMWHALKGIQDRAGWVGVLGSDPPQVRENALHAAWGGAKTRSRDQRIWVVGEGSAVPEGIYEK